MYIVYMIYRISKIIKAFHRIDFNHVEKLFPNFLSLPPTSKKNLTRHKGWVP